MTDQIRDAIKQVEAGLSALKAAIGDGGDTSPAGYIAARLHRVPGRDTPFADFLAAYKAWIPESERKEWTRGRMKDELARLGFVLRNTGRLDQPRAMIEGLSFYPPPEVETPKPPYDWAAFDEAALPMRRAGRKDNEIAAELNKLGILSPEGDQWTGQMVTGTW